jgi:phosphatidylserine decarboxylase
MLIYNRQTGTYIEEIEYKKELIDFLYNTIIGRILLKTVAARPWFSKIKAKYQNSTKSHKDIAPFIKKYNIDANADDYCTFNEFFTRKKEYQTNANEKELISIADSKLSVYTISSDLILKIKNTEYLLDELVDKKVNLSEYKNGTCLVFRLSVNDYHRYVFFDDGVFKNNYYIKGMLHTIRPIAHNHKVFSKNCREVSVLQTKTFGDVVQIEIGAMLVGKIKNHPITEFKRLDEKGYFEYGGSTIVILLKNNIKIDSDIVNETQVHIGERIGVLCSKD